MQLIYLRYSLFCTGLRNDNDYYAHPIIMHQQHEMSDQAS